MTIADEKLLSERIYFGDKTYFYVGLLRAFKLGYFEGTEIRRISDIAKILSESKDFTKTRHGEHILLTYSSILTELEKVWAVIKREETTQIDAYGYDVKIIH